jgi:rod shape determining protein RodA
MALQVQERTTIRKIDYNLALVVLALNLIGLINLYSATHGPSARGSASLFWFQILYLIVGWLMSFLTLSVGYRESLPWRSTLV